MAPFRATLPILLFMVTEVAFIVVQERVTGVGIPMGTLEGVATNEVIPT